MGHKSTLYFKCPDNQGSDWDIYDVYEAKKEDVPTEQDIYTADEEDKL